MKLFAVAVVFAPLAIATIAVIVRQSTRTEVAHPTQLHEFEEFVPPPLFSMATRAPGRDQTFAVEADSSAATLFGADRRGERIAVACELSGSATIDAGEAHVVLDLVIDRATANGAGIRPDEWPQLGLIALRAESIACNATDAPGTHACELRARWSVAGKTREEHVEAVWLRLPGNVVRMQLTLPIATLDSVDGWARRVQRLAPVRGELALDMTFKERR